MANALRLQDQRSLSILRDRARSWEKHNSSCHDGRFSTGDSCCPIRNKYIRKWGTEYNCPCRLYYGYSNSCRCWHNCWLLPSGFYRDRCPMTDFRVALTSADYKKCHDLLDRLGRHEHGELSFPTIMAFRGEKLVAFLSTM